MAPRSKLRLRATCLFAKGVDARGQEQAPHCEKCLHGPCAHGSSRAQPVGLTTTRWRTGPREGYSYPDTTPLTSAQDLITALLSMLDPVLTPKEGQLAMPDTYTSCLLLLGSLPRPPGPSTLM